VDGAVRYVTKLTNALKCMKVYYTHCIPPTFFATHVAILVVGILQWIDTSEVYEHVLYILYTSYMFRYSCGHLWGVGGGDACALQWIGISELHRYTILNFENNVWFKIEDS